MGTLKYDIKVRKGANFKLNIACQNDDRSAKDLTGYTAKAQVRATYGAAVALMDASTANGQITINAPGGIVMINVPQATTEAMNWTSGVWDLEITSAGGVIDRIVEGFASLSQEVTV
jgi:hypothetical protein